MCTVAVFVQLQIYSSRSYFEIRTKGKYYVGYVGVGNALKRSMSPR